jgi:sec-independent protein translocase protein TatB
MFGVDFSELIVIMVVALVVLGPERLPKAARAMGEWWGRAQRYINRIKADVNNSMELEQLRELERKVKDEADALERSVQQASNDINHEMQKLEKELDQPLQESATSVPPPAAVASQAPL